MQEYIIYLTEEQLTRLEKLFENQEGFEDINEAFSNADKCHCGLCSGNESEVFD